MKMKSMRDQSLIGRLKTMRSFKLREEVRMEQEQAEVDLQALESEEERLVLGRGRDN